MCATVKTGWQTCLQLAGVDFRCPLAQPAAGACTERQHFWAGERRVEGIHETGRSARQRRPRPIAL